MKVNVLKPSLNPIEKSMVDVLKSIKSELESANLIQTESDRQKVSINMVLRINSQLELVENERN